MTWTTTVRYSWLLDVYHQRCADQHWQMAARAFLLFLVETSTHAGGYAWGVVVLAYMYDNLREASMHQTRTVSGYLTLLQAWVCEHFPALCANCCRLSQIYDEDYPRALRWKPKRDKSLVIPFRKALDEIDVDDNVGHPT
uniref:Protein MAINTENANCE OF MERISTEMS-like n=1 Tax=Cicer arietinum TaxID=3827 RepID=A0A1S3E1P4_CICAR|nr:protein MAINTENANCE OF MERISTEMS-like [Cicer arietinum]